MLTHPGCSALLCAPELLLALRCSDVECLVEQGLQPREVGVLLLDAFAQQTYYSGFTHGDPHPGNLLVRVRTDPPPRLARLLGLGSRPRPQLVLLDHGVYVSMPEQPRRLYCQVRAAAVRLGKARLGKAFAAAGAFGESAEAGMLVGQSCCGRLGASTWQAVPAQLILICLLRALR